MGDLLFSEKDLGALIRLYESQAIKDEVEGWDKNKILAGSEPDLIAYLVEKYSLDPPSLRRDEMYVDGQGEVLIDVSGRFEYGMGFRDGPRHVRGAYVTIAIPFDGDPDLFAFRPSTFSTPPRGNIAGSTVTLTFRDVTLNADRMKGEIQAIATEIEQWLGWIKADCDAWNKRVPEVAGNIARARKQRLLQQTNTVSALGLPIRRRADAAPVVSVPVTRRKRPVSAPATPKEPFKPEPAIPEGEYDFILSVIDRMALNVERSPSTFVHMHEEQIRDMILVNLNGHYEGDATGETFNAEGKTDILIRAEGKNVFIAECKFWEGAKAFHAAIDQILGYLTWRDTKAALLIFSKNADFSNVLSAIGAATPEHPNFKRELNRVGDTHTRYLFRQKNDKDRDIYLSVLAFNIPRTNK